jgi:hypothetical protein
MKKLVRHRDVRQADPVLLHFAMLLGVQYGWRPAGTAPPLEWRQETWESWDEDDYWNGLGQEVTEEDASSWATALRSALDDFPDENLMPYRAEYLGVDRAASKSHIERRLVRMHKIPLAEIFSGDTKKWLIDLIGYLERGAFRWFWENS